MLNEKNKAYMIRLDKEEARKKQQLAILLKTHDTAIQEKDMLIGELEAVIDDQESRLSGQYSTDLEKIFRKGNKKLNLFLWKYTSLQFKWSNVLFIYKKLQVTSWMENWTKRKLDKSQNFCLIT